jgi:RNA polymerase primary sigma factor
MVTCTQLEIAFPDQNAHVCFSTSFKVVPTTEPCNSFSEISEKSSEPTIEQGSALNHTDAFDAYLDTINKYQLLDEEDEKELLRMAQSPENSHSEEATELLVLCNLRLVLHQAKRYSRYGCPLVDLIAEGSLGLQTAVRKFDFSHRGRFATYAVWWIKQHLRKAATENRTIRIPIYQQRRIKSIHEIVARHNEITGVDPSDEEIADELNLKTHQVSNLRNLTVPMISLQTQVGTESDTRTFEDILSDQSGNGESPLEKLTRKNNGEGLRDLIKRRLNKKEQEVILLRFGLTNVDTTPQTLEETGDALKLTRERIRQIQNSALQKLRNSIEAQSANKTTLLSL